MPYEFISPLSSFSILPWGLSANTWDSTCVAHHFRLENMPCFPSSCSLSGRTQKDFPQDVFLFRLISHLLQMLIWGFELHLLWIFVPVKLYCLDVCRKWAEKTCEYMKPLTAKCYLHLSLWVMNRWVGYRNQPENLIFPVIFFNGLFEISLNTGVMRSVWRPI